MMQLLQGDALEVLRTIPDETVQTCITSPPYFNLRDYQIEGQIGLESTPDEYVARLVEVFREVRRVLADDGTLWLNLGDSYTANGGGGERRMIELGNPSPGALSKPHMLCDKKRSTKTGLKPKDLVGIPWRVAFALQADGWYLRQDIIWHKPNPMPEPVRDRCTKAHEYIFLLSKSPRYWFDHDEMREPNTTAPRVKDLRKNWEDRPTNGVWEPGSGGRMGSISNGRNRRDVWTVATKPYPECHFATFPPDLIRPCVLAGAPEGATVLDPFSGAATTGLVALEHGRRYIGIELNPTYIALAEERLRPLLEQPRLDAFTEGTQA